MYKRNLTPGNFRKALALAERTLVIVNGQLAFEDGKMTPARPGCVLYGASRKP